MSSEARGSPDRTGSEVPNDGALLARIAAGDRAAAAVFVARHKAALFRFAEALLRDRSLAEDVLQETLLAALRAAATFRAEGSARGWLFTIARHAALKLRPREQPLSDDEDMESLGARAGWGAPDAEEQLAGWQSRAIVQRALAALPAEDREVLVLRDAEGLSGPEAADVLQISLAAMKSRLHRARLRMLAALRTSAPDEVAGAARAPSLDEAASGPEPPRAGARAEETAHEGP